MKQFKNAIYVIILFLVTIYPFHLVQSADAVNIIQNSGVEIDENNDSLPDGWNQGPWGDNAATFSYPVSGVNNSKAIAIEITSFSSGDAKWYFDDVPVVPNTQYAFSDYYVSNVDTELDVRFTDASGEFSYSYIKNLPAVSDWSKAEALIDPPQGTVSMTVFHPIFSIGKISIDDFSLIPIPASDTTFDSGFVSLTFDDGWLDHKNTVVPILDKREIKGTFYIISGETDQSISNPSFEVDLDKNNVPDNWDKNVSGKNKTVFNYPVTSSDGSKAVGINITSYTNGAAFWSFKEIPVKADRTHVFSDRYKSTVATKVIARIRNTSGGTQDVTIGTAKASSSWKNFNASFYVPTNAQTITIFHQLKSKGSISVDDFKLSRKNNTYVTASDIMAMENSGHEIGAHTRTHAHLTELNSTDANNEIAGSRNDLLNMGIKKILSFAYPYGEYNDSVKQIISSSGFSSARSVEEGFAGKNSDKMALIVKNVLNTTTVAEMKSWIDQAKANKKWLIVVTHHVDNSNDPYGTTAAKFTSLVDYIKQTNIPVLTVAQGMDLLK
jgi:peptidoglycan/xylan/chitin deacetylase (PgdA/CDA1 family)